MSSSHRRCRRDSTVEFSRVVGVANVNWIADDCRRISVENLETEQVQNLRNVTVCENCCDPVSISNSWVSGAKTIQRTMTSWLETWSRLLRFVELRRQLSRIGLAGVNSVSFAVMLCSWWWAATRASNAWHSVTQYPACHGSRTRGDCTTTASDWSSLTHVTSAMRVTSSATWYWVTWPTTTPATTSK